MRLLSMTGYGRCRLEKNGRDMTVEVKSVNHRFLDLSCRLPRNLGFLDDCVRDQTARRVARGHLDIFVSYENQRDDARDIRVDLPLAKALARGAEQLHEALGLSDSLTLADLLRYPDVVTMQEREEDQEAVRALFQAALEGALEGLIAMRQTEGAHLRDDLHAKVDQIEALRDQIQALSEGVVDAYRERLSQRMVALLGGQLDEARFRTEVALFADRSAIDEELTRLGSHIVQIRSVCGLSEPVGRKLDFLVQELNREFNTIASKAADARIAQLVVEAKGEIEKLREQVQNIE